MGDKNGRVSRGRSKNSFHRRRVEWVVRRIERLKNSRSARYYEGALGGFLDTCSSTPIVQSRMVKNAFQRGLKESQTGNFKKSGKERVQVKMTLDRQRYKGVEPHQKHGGKLYEIPVYRDAGGRERCNGQHSTKNIRYESIQHMELARNSTGIRKGTEKRAACNKIEYYLITIKRNYMKIFIYLIAFQHE
ncbi:hypothetical protein HHI36_009100 [Cryptolaemus montrouzieri]|uniref:Uncharacterized protein n=1 Tax=Cryptolaemus montrouzieri TaxID=559131 RepID=A0ABD2MUI8_9CUCU